MTSPEEADRPRVERPLCAGVSSLSTSTSGDLQGVRRFFPRARARAQSQRFGPVSAASAANTRDAPRDGRPSAPAARPRRAAPLEAARRRPAAPRRSAAPAARRAAPTTVRASRRRNRPGRGAIASGRSRHRSRAPSRWPARPCAPCRARAAAWPWPTARRAFPRRVRRARPRASGAFGPASRRAAACFFGWVPGPAPAGRASARKIKRGLDVVRARDAALSTSAHGRAPAPATREGVGGVRGEVLQAPPPDLTRSAK